MDLRIVGEFQDGSLGEVKPSAFICKQDQHSSLFSETQTPTNTGKNRSPRCSSAGEHAQENTANCQYNTAHCVEGQASGAAATTDGFGLSAVESKEYCKLVLAETFSISYRKEQNLQVEYTEEKKYISEELRCKKEDSKLKRKEDSEGADLEKERKQRKRIKPDVDLVNEEKSRPNKDERLKKKPAKKQRKKRVKNQQASQIEIKTEHGAFWEDSGFIFWWGFWLASWACSDLQVIFTILYHTMAVVVFVGSFGGFMVFVCLSKVGVFLAVRKSLSFANGW